MDQDKQTLLQAAKMVLAIFGGYTNECIADLRAAIAREEAMVSTPHPTRWWQVECQKATDRAQQAEADAAWHKAESARLSAELARERKSRDAFRNQVDALRDELQVAPDETTLHAAKALRQRAELAELDASTEREITKRTREYLGAAQDQTTWIAAAAMRERVEKAEAELATFRSFFVSAHQISDTMPAAEVVDAAQRIINRDAGQLARLGHSTPMDVGKVLPLVVDELLRLRAELATAKQARQLDRAVATLASIPPVDPATGWTFATYRRVVEALGGKS